MLAGKVAMQTQTDELLPTTQGQWSVVQPHSGPQASLPKTVRRFLQQRWLASSLVSALLLVPCFWHRYIVAGDLDSHVYNAWLVRLIQHGQAPGLWIARQWDNVLFDLMLSHLGDLFGLHVAERIAVSISILVFFWGSFSLIAAATRRAPWFLAPCLAMLSYGWTFQMGFLNYYISLGLSFFALAIVWRGRHATRFLGLVLAPLIWLAHPIGLAWLAGAAAYIGLAELLPGRTQIFLVAASAILLVLVSWYLNPRYPGPSASMAGLAANGANQLDLVAPRYVLPARLVLVFALICLLGDILWRRNQPEVWNAYKLPLQLYVVAILGVSLLPDGIHVPQFGAPITLLTPRFSSICAVLGCCLLGAATPRRWHLVGFAIIAAIYFSLLYQDTARAVQIETQTEQLVSTLPPGSRVTSPLLPIVSQFVLSAHIVDRACIERCFSYSNYEPGTQQFRVRAMPGNRIVAPTVDTAIASLSDRYLVPVQEAPMFHVYPCEQNATRMCLRKLAVGISASNSTRLP
jgi:hypothetical protein